MAIRPYVNELYQINDESSLFQMKLQYKSFLENYATSSFNSILKNQEMELDKHNKVFSWEMDSQSIAIRNKNTTTIFFKGDDRYIRQDISRNLEPNTNYTVVLDYICNNPINFSIETEYSDIIIDVVNNFSSNLYCNLQCPGVGETYKRTVLRFKTSPRIENYNNPVLLTFGNSLGYDGTFIEIKNVLVYGSNVEVSSVTTPMTTEFFETSINAILYHKLDQEIWCVKEDIRPNFIVVLYHLKYITGLNYSGKSLEIFLNGNRLTCGREYVEELFYDNTKAHFSRRVLFRIPIWKDDEVVFKNDLLTLLSDATENEIFNMILFKKYIPYEISNIQVVDRNVLDYCSFSSYDKYRIGTATVNQTNRVGIPIYTDFIDNKIKLTFFPVYDVEVYINGLRQKRDSFVIYGDVLQFTYIPDHCEVEVFHIQNINNETFDYNINNEYSLPIIMDKNNVEVFYDGLLLDLNKFTISGNVLTISSDIIFSKLDVYYLNIDNKRLYESYNESVVFLNENSLRDKILLDFQPTKNLNVAVYFDGVKVFQNKYYLSLDSEIGYFDPLAVVNCSIVYASGIPDYKSCEIETWKFNRDITANFILKLKDIKYASGFNYSEKCLEIYLNGNRLICGREYQEEVINESEPFMFGRVFFRIPIWTNDELVFKVYNPNLIDKGRIGEFLDPLYFNAQIIEKPNDLLI